MKFIKRYNFIFSIIFTLGIFSCKSTDLNSNRLPIIKNPMYKSMDYGSEKGYLVTFELNKNTPKPTDIVLFGVRKKINSDNIKNGKVETYVIFQTQKLENYQINSTNLPNGVIFEIDSKKYLKTVDFKLNN